MNVRNKIIHGNCIELLSEIPDETFHMVITSPPYDNLRKYEGIKFNFTEIAKQLYRILRTGRVLIWIVNDATINGSETGTSFRQALEFIDIGFNLHDTMIFRKKNPIPQIYRKRYTCEFEYMFVLSKGRVEVHNPIRVPCSHAGLELDSTTYKNYSRGKQKRTKYANTVKKEKVKGNIWDYVVGKNVLDQGAKEHPAPFPIQLALDHIISWTNEGDMVLDPMCGSGTACLAAAMQKRIFTGIDLSENYCSIAEQRIFKVLETNHNELKF